MPETLIQTDAKQSMLRIRGSFGAVLDALPEPAERPHEIAKALGVDKKLGWQIARLVHEPDVFAAAQYLPGKSGVETVLGRAAQRGVPPELVEDARSAIEAFDGVVETHAGERSSMNMMLAAASPKRDAAECRRHRKNAFVANSYIWGVQARTQLACFVLHPSDAPGRIDIASARGLVELRRIRPDVPWGIGRVRCVDDDGDVRTAMDLEPIEAQPARADGLLPVPLLADFCSSPLPQVRRVRARAGFLEDELVGAPAGNRGVVTCITGELARAAASRYRNEHNELAVLNVCVRTPVEAILVDAFIHRDLVPPGAPELRAYSDLGGPPMAVARPDRERLDPGTELEHLGFGRAAAYTPHFSRESALADHVCDRMGWSRDDLELYRVVIEHPVLPSSVRLQWSLPEAGNGPG